jgi:hypothetical protein
VERPWTYAPLEWLVFAACFALALGLAAGTGARRLDHELAPVTGPVALLGLADGRPVDGAPRAVAAAPDGETRIVVVHRNARRCALRRRRTGRD